MDRFTAASKLPFSKKKLPKRIILSYILDYVIIVGLVIAFTAVDKIEPFKQHFSLENYTLHYDFAENERIPVSMLVVYACFAPAVIIAVYTIVIDGLFSHQIPSPHSAGRRRLSGRYRFKDRLWELNCGILGLGLSVAFAFTVTGALKNAIGKPRPDIVSRCKPNLDLIPKTSFSLVNSTICDQNVEHHILADGFKSFPSGHSSVSFAGLFYLSLYLAAKLHILDSKGEVWKSFVVLVPTVAAALIAGTRIMDARHHPFDVLSGSALGILVAWGSYRQYFPPLHETWRKGRAYPIRSWGNTPARPDVDTRMDDGTEPLRSSVRAMPVDEERPPSGSSTSVDEHRGNVFRQQISTSQRQREATSPGLRAGLQYSGDAAGPKGQTSSFPPNPYSNKPYRGRDDNYDESSSDDDHDIELRPQYTLTGPDTGSASYDPKFGSSTAYNPSRIGPLPAESAHGQQRGIMSPNSDVPNTVAGDLGDVQRKPPQGQEEQKGVNLVETYAK